MNDPFADIGQISQSQDMNQSIIDLTNQAKQKGVKYGFGQKDKSSGSIDCSGWSCDLASNLGIKLNGSAAEIAKQKADQGLLSQDKPITVGDIVFGAGAPHAKDRFGGIGHMGIVVQQGKRLYVSEATPKGPDLTPIEDFWARYKDKGLYTAPLTNQQKMMASMNQRLSELQQRDNQPTVGSDFYSTGMNFFISKGYSPAQAAGIVGNLMHESGGKTDILHDSGKGYGLAGWNGDRKSGLYQFAGTETPDLMQQLAYVDYELKNTEPKAYQMLQNSKTPEQAAQIFSQYYERPGKPMMASRIDQARKAMNLYSMGQVGNMTANAQDNFSDIGKGNDPFADIASEDKFSDIGSNQPEYTMGQKIARTVSPYTKVILPGVGMAAGGALGSSLGPAGTVGGMTLLGGAGNAIQNEIERYAGLRPEIKSSKEALTEGTKNLIQSGTEALMAETGGNLTERLFGYLGNKLAPRIAQWTLKPSTTLSKSEREVILNTSLKGAAGEGGYTTSLSGLDKLKGVMDTAQREIDGLVMEATQAGKKIPTNAVISRLKDTINKYKETDLPGEYRNKILDYAEKLVNEHPEYLTPNVAHQIKKKMYKIIEDAAYGQEFVTITKDMKKDFTRGLREELENIIPELGALNKAQGKRIEFQNVLEKAVGRLDNKYPLGFYDILSGGVVGTATADPYYGLATSLASKVMLDPKVNSWLAINLSKLGKEGNVIPSVIGRTGGFIIGQPTGNYLADKVRKNILYEPSFQP